MRFLKPETVRSIYRGVLKRSPTRSEVSNFALDFARNPDLQVRLNSMIYSKEFQVMVLPDLVRFASENFSGRKVFFLHVPKTAGTSVRLAITDALSMPAFSLYALSTQLPPQKMDSMGFWPYWAGHANISAFPETHDGFTTFRETRSRLLSQFRQIQFNADPESNPHLISKKPTGDLKVERGTRKHRDFNDWIARNPLSILRWYIPNPGIQRDLPIEESRRNFQLKVGTTQAWAQTVDEMSELDIAKALEKSMSRFRAAGWLHQPKGIEEAIAKITGNPQASLPMENEFKKSELYKVETISAESLEALEVARKRDRIVFKIATDQGILTDELRADEDEIFHKSVEKLGYRFS